MYIVPLLSCSNAVTRRNSCCPAAITKALLDLAPSNIGVGEDGIHASVGPFAREVRPTSPRAMWFSHCQAGFDVRQVLPLSFRTLGLGSKPSTPLKAVVGSFSTSQTHAMSSSVIRRGLKTEEVSHLVLAALSASGLYVTCSIALTKYVGRREFNASASSLPFLTERSKIHARYWAATSLLKR